MINQNPADVSFSPCNHEKFPSSLFTPPPPPPNNQFYSSLLSMCDLLRNSVPTPTSGRFSDFYLNSHKKLPPTHPHFLLYPILWNPYWPGQAVAFRRIKGHVLFTSWIIAIFLEGTLILKYEWPIKCQEYVRRCQLFG